jgi:hypothetical protein
MSSSPRQLIYILIALTLLQPACRLTAAQVTPTPTKTPRPVEETRPERATPTLTPSPTPTVPPSPTVTPLPPPTATPPPPPPTNTPLPLPTKRPPPPATKPPPPSPTTPPTTAPPPPASPTPVPTVSQGPAVTLNIDPQVVTAGDEVKITVTAHDDNGVRSLEWAAVLAGRIMSSNIKDCGGEVDCKLGDTLQAPLKGIFEIYARAWNSKDHDTIVKDTLYVG